jgi:hypothetical protein
LGRVERLDIYTCTDIHGAGRKDNSFPALPRWDLNRLFSHAGRLSQPAHGAEFKEVPCIGEIIAIATFYELWIIDVCIPCIMRGHYTEHVNWDLEAR